MIGDNENGVQELEESEELLEEGPSEFIFDFLTGARVSATPRNKLMQKVLRQLIESYGFDRNDIVLNYNPRIAGKGRLVVDIAIFRSGTEHSNESLHRVILCKTQRKREKLRTVDEAESDWRALTLLMEHFENVSFGLWTNGQEEFFFRLERTRFETRPKPLGMWPVPGEGTTDIERTGGVTQIAADAEGLEDALLRCHRFLNRNLGLDHKEAFKQLALLLFTKIFDETRLPADRKFWITGDEPFTSGGQQAIHTRITTCFREAARWKSLVLARGWELNLEPHELSRLVMELARYSFSDTQPAYRKKAFRSIVRSVMDGREGRYPTPLNVADMAVRMMNPSIEDRLLDCSCGTGTFLSMASEYIFESVLAELGATPDIADPDMLRIALTRASEWASTNTLGCEIDPFLAVASRMNMLFTIGDPGRIFRIDARTFPDGDLDGIQASLPVLPLGSMDMVIVNPWFSTQQVVTDHSILNRYELGRDWVTDENGGYRNSGNISTAGIPPEIIFLERAIQWAKPGTGKVGILLPDGVLGNPGYESVRWWILRKCEVLACVDLPIEPFKVTVKEYGLTPALPSFLLLRKRSAEELLNTVYPEYSVFMAVVAKAGVDARGNLLFRRAPDGEEMIFRDETVERVRIGDQFQISRISLPTLRIHDELPIVAEKYKEYCLTGEVGNE